MVKGFRVLVLGYGRMGHAMQRLLSPQHTLCFWDCNPQPGLKSIDLEQSASQADFVLFCIPVNPHREIASRLAPFLSKQCICLSIAKGLDENGYTAARIFSDVFGNTHFYGLLYGPMIAENIIADQAGFAQLGYSEQSVPKQVMALFDHTTLYIRPSTDATGISWAVILKNVYAMLFGIADELHLGDNMRGFLAVQTLEELDAIVQGMGGKVRTPWHLAGLGDLITTATSPGSHHHDLGRKLARGEIFNLTGEGVHTLEMVDKHKLFDSSAYPLYRLIHDFVHEPRDIKKQLRTYLESEFNPD
ncbi:MAG: hypothetical protein ACE5DY_00445 [Mariprofundaceae bacterium]